MLIIVRGLACAKASVISILSFLYFLVKENLQLMIKFESFWDFQLVLAAYILVGDWPEWRSEFSL
jgi:hypothetical protein